MNDRIGKFRILEEVGRGGMGIVYRAVDETLDRVVAVKVLPPSAGRDFDFAARFEREAKLIARLNHPAIVGVYSAGEEGGVPYFAMEFVEGSSLRSVLIREKRLPLVRALEIVRRAAHGLAHAHEKGVIHRDLKPGNILIDRSGSVKITDFGLAKLLTETRVSSSGEMIGTLSYMSPEQVEGKDVDWRTDLYSLGIILYEMLAGFPPFSADSPIALARKIAEGKIPDIRASAPGLPDACARLIRKMTAVRPAARYGGIRELLEDVGRLEDDLRKVVVAREIEQRRSRRKAGLLVAGGGVLAAVALWLFLPRVSRSPSGPASPRSVILPAAIPVASSGAGPARMASPPVKGKAAAEGKISELISSRAFRFVLERGEGLVPDDGLEIMRPGPEGRAPVSIGHAVVVEAGRERPAARLGVIEEGYTVSPGDVVRSTGVNIGRLEDESKPLLREKKFGPAASLFRALLPYSPERANFGLGICYFAQEDYPRAREFFLRLGEERTSKAWNQRMLAALYLAECALEGGDAAAARREFEAALESIPERSRGTYRLSSPPPGLEERGYDSASPLSQIIRKKIKKER